METQPKTFKKGGEIVDLQISPPKVPPKKKGKIEDPQMFSPEVLFKKKGKIEDL